MERASEALVCGAHPGEERAQGVGESLALRLPGVSSAVPEVALARAPARARAGAAVPGLSVHRARRRARALAIGSLDHRRLGAAVRRRAADTGAGRCGRGHQGEGERARLRRARCGAARRAPLRRESALRVVGGGAFADLVGLFDCAGDNERVTILFDLLGRQVKIRVPLTAVTVTA